MNLKLKHLAPYLPYKIKCQYFGIVDVSKYHKFSFLNLFSEEETGMGFKIGELKEIKFYKKYRTAHIGTFHGHLKSFINGHDFKIILRPLTDLTKEISHNGEKFVPIIELLKLSLPNRPTTGRYSEIEVSVNGYPSAWYTYSAPHSITVRPPEIEKTDFWIIQKLFEWHFDVFGLIDKGLAIPIKDEQ